MKKVVLFIQIPTVNEGSVTGDADPTLFSTQVSQSESQVAADHTEHLQIKTNMQTQEEQTLLYIMWPRGAPHPK